VRKQINVSNVFDPLKHFSVLVGICMYLLGLREQIFFYLNRCHSLLFTGRKGNTAGKAGILLLALEKKVQGCLQQ